MISYLVAVRQYESHLEVLDAVASGEVDAALLDTFIATSLQDIISQKKLRLAELFKANSGFGIVLSGYMVKLKSSINGLIASNQAVIMEFMTQMQSKVPVSIDT